MINWALLVLRLGLGIMFIAHSMQMAFGLYGGPGVKGFAEMLSKMGFVPAMLWSSIACYGVFLAGICVLLGLVTRPAALFLLVFISVAMIKVHLPKGFFLNTGGFEYTFIIASICVALLLAGAGKFSLDAYLNLCCKK